MTYVAAETGVNDELLLGQCPAPPLNLSNRVQYTDKLNMSFQNFIVRYLNLLASMDPSGSDDDGCLSVQLGSSDRPWSLSSLAHLDINTHFIPY
jgi:hypothetical protein